MRFSLLAAATALIALASSALAADRNVYPGQSIQAAINLAQNGDRVLIHPGTYSTGMRLQGKQITVEGVGVLGGVTIDTSAFNAPALLADSGETYQTVVRNLKFRIGNNGGQSRLLRITAAQLTVENVVVEESSAGGVDLIDVQGGGLRVNHLTWLGATREFYQGSSANTILANVTIHHASSGVSGQYVIETTGGTLLIKDTEIRSRMSRVVRAVGTDFLEPWRNIVLNGEFTGGGVWVDRSLSIDGFEFRNMRQYRALWVSMGGLNLSSGIFESCMSDEHEAFGPLAGAYPRHWVAGAAVFVPQPGVNGVNMNSVVFESCRFTGRISENNNCGVGATVYGPVVFSGSGISTYTSCEFRNATFQNTNVFTSFCQGPGGQLHVGLAIYHQAGECRVLSCKFLSTQVIPSGVQGSAVALGYSAAGGQGVLLVEDSEVVEPNYNSSSCIHLYGSPVSIAGCSIRTSNGSVVQGASSIALNDVQAYNISPAAIAFQSTGAIAATKVSVVNTLGLGSSQAPLFLGGTVVVLSRSRFSGLRKPIISIGSGGASMTDCVVDQLEQTMVSSGTPGSLAVDRCTFFNNAAGLVVGGGATLSVRNSIVRQSGSLVSGSAVLQLAEFSCFDVVPAVGVGNIAAEPGFADPFLGDYSLLPSSPCRDVADPAIQQDADGTRADMGSRFQYGVPDCNLNGVSDIIDIFTQDCNANLVVDSCELTGTSDCNTDSQLDSCQIASMALADCDGDMTPDVCSLDCDMNGQADVCQLLAVPALDCDQNGVLDSCEIVFSAQYDCNGNGQLDRCEVVAGTSLDLDGDFVPDECKPDCDLDSLPDFLEIAYGTADDCNGDGLPDNCAIIITPSIDCDGDGRLDSCEIASTASLDCDANGILDVCQLLTGDCNGNMIPDACDISAGFSTDVDSNGYPDECKADCNSNGVPDYVEIALGAAKDCNVDGIPDECNVLTGATPDCNGNGNPDSCDILNGTSLDVDANGVPDECLCVASNFCVPEVNSTGQPALISLVGTASLSANNAGLRCTQLPSTTAGLFFFGTGSLNPGNPFGNGRLCISGSIRRLPLTQAVAGVVNQAQNFGSTPYAGIQAGDVRFFQFWYRNTAAGGAGFNLSDGIRVTFCP